MYENYIFQEESRAIIDAAYTVHKTLGTGFVEAVYQEALAIELSQRGVPFTQQQELTIYYGTMQLQKKFYADFLCYNAIILELKATQAIAPEHRAQILNYLRASKLHLGLLINFGEPKINIQRFIA
ncbi:MAG: GxxExxY protein [Alloprevotella sp.]|nr:GxxExxY protein [Alloprevotella sp.]